MRPIDSSPKAALILDGLNTTLLRSRIASLTSKNFFKRLFQSIEELGYCIVGAEEPKPDLELQVNYRRRPLGRYSVLLHMEPPEVWPRNFGNLGEQFNLIFTCFELISSDSTRRVPFPSCTKPLPTFWDDDRSNQLVMLAANKVARQQSQMELYTLRAKLIDEFSTNLDWPVVHYGYGWNEPNMRPGFMGKAIHAIYKLLPNAYLSKPSRPKWRGVAKDKFYILSRHNFSLVIENSRHPGYVSEKMFDSLVCGCIPVYLGDPRISKKIPPEVFIDFEKFRKLEFLFKHLSEITDEKLLLTRHAIFDFLTNEAPRTFGEDLYMVTLLSELKKLPMSVSH